MSLRKRRVIFLPLFMNKRVILERAAFLFVCEWKEVGQLTNGLYRDRKCIRNFI